MPRLFGKESKLARRLPAKDANGRYINYIELLEVVWACVRKEIGVE